MSATVFGDFPLNSTAKNLHIFSTTIFFKRTAITGRTNNSPSVSLGCGFFFYV